MLCYTGSIMNLQQKLLRSQNTDDIDYTKYQPVGQDDPLVRLSTNDRVLIEPYWELEDDWEGRHYAAYIAEHPAYDGIYIRSELAKRLQVAASSLDDTYKLVIRAGHRPIDVQHRILVDCADNYKRDHPEVSDAEALEHARTYVSDPAITLPPHVCGGAVDVDVLDKATGQLLDFGSKVNEDNEKSFLYYPGLTPQQKSNRLMLVTAMLEAGIASWRLEWWHFSYGDQHWAWFYGHENSLYNPIDL
jgi:D-alanyl-D-alanine dipeptidase